MAARERTEAQIEAERRYRASKPQVLIRFTPEEMKAIDKACAGDRPGWIKAVALAAAAAKRTR